MKVSIIVPVFKVSSYIERCLVSVMNQDYTPLECILVDDASPDDSMIKAHALLAGYNGSITFKTLKHQQNKGLSAARNTGLLEASGEYLFFLDSDDALLGSCIQLLVKRAVETGYPDLVQGSTKVSGMNSNPFKYQIHRSIPSYVKDKEWIEKSMLERKKVPVTAWNKLIRKEFLLKNELLFKDGVWHEDEHWTFLLASKVQSIAFCYEPTYEHFITEGSIMSIAGQRSIDSWFLLLEDFINQQGLESRFQRKAILERLFCQLVRILDGSSDMLESNLKKLQLLVGKRRKSSLKRFCSVERLLLWCYKWPLPLMRIVQIRWIRSMYFRVLTWFI